MTADEVEEDEEEQEDLDLTGSICPKCGDGAGLREIIYGLTGPVDEDKFIVGGCCVDDDSHHDWRRGISPKYYAELILNRSRASSFSCSRRALILEKFHLS